MSNEYFIYFRAIIALGFVTGLIWLLALGLKKSGWQKRFTGNKNTRKRLSIEETLYIDPKTRLVLVQWDTKEHLLLVGATSVVVDSREKEGDHAP